MTVENAKPADPLRMYRRALSAIDPDARVSWLAGAMRITQAQARDFLDASDRAVYGAARPEPVLSKDAPRKAAKKPAAARKRADLERPSEKAMRAVDLASKGFTRTQIADLLGYACPDSAGSALRRARLWLAAEAGSVAA